MSLATGPFFFGFNVTTIVELPLRKMGLRDFESNLFSSRATTTPKFIRPKACFCSQQ